jgi:hypothetical protein
MACPRGLARKEVKLARMIVLWKDFYPSSPEDWFATMHGRVNAALREKFEPKQVKMTSSGTTFPGGEVIREIEWVKGSGAITSITVTFEEDDKLAAFIIDKLAKSETPTYIGLEWEDKRTIEELEQVLREQGWRIISILPDSLIAEKEYGKVISFLIDPGSLLAKEPWRIKVRKTGKNKDRTTVLANALGLGVMIERKGADEVLKGFRELFRLLLGK